MRAAALLFLATSVVAQDLASILQGQTDLTTLLGAVTSVPGLVQTLASSSNITILAPTNSAFEALNAGTAEGAAVANNDTAAIGALLSLHVIKGLYPAANITETPAFVQTLLNSTTYTNITGGQYIGVIKDGSGVKVLSGGLNVATVTQADIRIGNVIIHKIDNVLRFAQTAQVATGRDSNLRAVNAALQVAGIVSADSTSVVNNRDTTLFLPNNGAFEAIGSAAATLNTSALGGILAYHVVPGRIVFSPSLGNISVTSLQGAQLTFTVTPNGEAFVNQAKIVFPNVLLNNGVGHVIDAVLNPGGNFNRTALNPSAPVASRVAFAGASSAPLAFTTYANPQSASQYASTAAIFTTARAVASQISGSARPSGNGGGSGTGAAAPGLNGMTAIIVGAVVASVFGGMQLVF